MYVADDRRIERLVTTGFLLFLAFGLVMRTSFGYGHVGHGFIAVIVLTGISEASLIGAWLYVRWLEKRLQNQINNLTHGILESVTTAILHQHALAPDITTRRIVSVEEDEESSSAQEQK